MGASTALYRAAAGGRSSDRLERFSLLQPMRAYLLLSLLLLGGYPSGVIAQERGRPHVAMDAWRIRPGQRARYLAFLDSNWVPARQEARRRGLVRDFRVVVLDSAAAAAAGWDVLLLTAYVDRRTWAQREMLFAPILARRGLVRIEGFGPRDLASFVWDVDGAMTRVSPLHP